MKKPLLNRYVLIGAGNAATNFAYALNEKGKKIEQIYSRTIGNAKLLAGNVNADSTDDLNRLIKDADVYIVSVSDGAIKDVVSHISLKEGFLLHTAGSAEMNILRTSAKNYGVIYPLQTLSKVRNIDFYNNVPLCIEANNNENEELLYEMSKELSKEVYKVNSADRKILHLAAVFVNNFTNYIFVSASRLLKVKNLSEAMLMPIISETMKIIKEKGMNDIPVLLTGPAVRKDMETINAHKELLEHFPDLKKVYETITNAILEIK